MIATELTAEHVRQFRDFVKDSLQTEFNGLGQRSPMVDGVCRCGLCCVVLPIRTFNKGGVVCNQLARKGDGMFDCGIYSQRPEICRKYDCQGRYPLLRAQLDDVIVNILSGQDQIAYYNDPEEEETLEVEEAGQVMEQMRRFGVLQHSLVAQTFRSSREFGRVEALLIGLTIIPQNLQRRKSLDQRVIEGLGINEYLTRLSSEHTSRLLATADSLVTGVIGEGDVTTWQPTVHLVRIGLNSAPKADFKVGVERYLEGDVSLPSEFRQWLSAFGGLTILTPSTILRPLLQAELYGCA